MKTKSFPGLEMFNTFKQTLREEGFSGLRRKYGWKVFAAIIVYYLIRDVTLYIIIPYFIVDHVKKF